MFNKPNYIDQKYVEATNSGWIDNRTGEILVAVPQLLNRLTQSETKYETVVEGEFIEEKTKVEEIQDVTLQHLDPEPSLEEQVDQSVKEDVIKEFIDVLNVVKEAKVEDEKPKAKRGRKPKEKVVVEPSE